MPTAADCWEQGRTAPASICRTAYQRERKSRNMRLRYGGTVDTVSQRTASSSQGSLWILTLSPKQTTASQSQARSSRNAVPCWRRARLQEPGYKAFYTQGQASWRCKPERHNISLYSNMWCQAPTHRIQPLLLVQKLRNVLYGCSQHALLLEKLDTPLGLLVEAVPGGDKTQVAYLKKIGSREKDGIQGKWLQDTLNKPSH